MSGQFTITPPMHMIHIANHNEVLVSIDSRTGQVTFGKNYNADEASTIFWRGLGLFCPTTAPQNNYSDYDYAMKGLV